METSQALWIVYPSVNNPHSKKGGFMFKWNFVCIGLCAFVSGFAFFTPLSSPIVSFCLFFHVDKISPRASSSPALIILALSTLLVCKTLQFLNHPGLTPVCVRVGAWNWTQHSGAFHRAEQRRRIASLTILFPRQTSSLSLTQARIASS